MPRETRALEGAEAVVDEMGLRGALEAIADVCELKADHLTDNWQDIESAKVWRRAAMRIRKFASTSVAVKAATL